MAYHVEKSRDAAPASSRSGPAAHPVTRLLERLGLAGAVVVGILLLLGIIAWIAVPRYARDYINEKGKTMPDYWLHIDALQVNLWNCSVDITAVRLNKKSSEIPVPFFNCPRVRFALQWSEILNRSFRSSVILDSPTINFVQGPTEEQSQTILEPAWVQAVQKAVPLQINQFQIHNGTLHFYDFHADPQIDLDLEQLNLVADNLTNSTHSKAEMPTVVTMTGHPFKVGELEVHLAANVDKKQPTFAQKVRLEKVPAPALNAFLAKYGSVNAKSGELAFYTEMTSHDGNFEGYVKPFFQDLEFEPVPKDRGGPAAIWSAVANGVKDVLQDKRNAVATNIPISGHYDKPDVHIFTAAFGLIKNAYLQMLATDFNKPEMVPNTNHTQEK